MILGSLPPISLSEGLLKLSPTEPFPQPQLLFYNLKDPVDERAVKQVSTKVSRELQGQASNRQTLVDVLELCYVRGEILD